jgi:hypothetical protein
MNRIQIDPSQRVVGVTGKPLSPVTEVTIYPTHFPILLRERMQGRTIAEVSDHLGIKATDVIRLLDGSWRPSKAIRNRLGLKVVYALGEPPK